ncbi:MAG TPA: glycosyltransferase [Anaerolineales bacterium]
MRAELRAQGVQMHVIDDVENPFVFGEDRTRIINRSKITLNLLRTWYDENSLRICMSAPNRSLVVSEPLLPHVPQYRPGVHYVSAPIEDLSRTILYYLEHADERQRIVENAYQLTTQVLTFGRSIQVIMDAAVQARHRMLSAGALDDEQLRGPLPGNSLTPDRSRN